MKEKTKYVLTYPNNKFVAIDKDSGYPYENEDYPHIWFKIEEAEKYQEMFPKENLSILGMEYSLREIGVTKEIEVYVDAVDFQHEIGEGNAPGPHFIYNTLKEIKEKQPCVEQCGVYRAKLVSMEMISKSNYEKTTKHKISFSEKYRLMKIALSRIANFSHSEDCECTQAPVYECGCYDKSQWDLAAEALEKVKDD